MSRAIPIFGNVGPEPAKLLLPRKTLLQLTQAYPPVVIEGLLRETEIILMGGQAKRWKSWARADMLYCVNNGFPWLGFPTHQGNIIHFDLELLEADIRWRFEQIHQSYCKEGLKGTLENLHFVALRGQSFTVADLDSVVEQLKDPHYSIASLDPVYRLLASKSESDQAAVAELLNKFLQFGFTIKAAIALLQHFAKGDQSMKQAQDRFSGSGVWSRYPDATMTFTDLEDENCFSVEFTLRSFQPIEPFAVRWDFPRFRIDEKLDPDDLKKPPGRPKKSSVEDFCAILTFGETIPYRDFQRRAQQLLSISSATFERRLREARKLNFIYQSKSPETLDCYGLTPAYCAKNGQ